METSESMANEVVDNVEATENTGMSYEDNGQQASENTGEKEIDWASLKRKIKVNGEEREITADQAIRDYQKYLAADEKFRSAAEMNKKAKSILEKYGGIEEAFNSGKFDVLLNRIPKDKLQEMAEDIVWEKMQYEQLSPEEKRIKELEAKVSEREKADKEAKEEAEKERQATLNAQAVRYIDEQISNTFKDLGVKPTPRLVARMAQHMLAALDTEGSLLDGKSAYTRSRYDLRQDVPEYLSSLDTKELLDVLPKEVVNAIRKHSVDEVVSQARPARQNKDDNFKTTNRKSKLKMSTDDFFKKMDEQFA